MSDNEGQQTEELEALSAIYGTDWRKEIDDKDSYSMKINREVQLFVTLHSDYPSDKPPSYQLLAPTLTGEQKQQAYNDFDDIYKSNLGGPVLFQWIEKLKEIIDNGNEIGKEVEIEELEEAVGQADALQGVAYDIIHGSIIQDRKSTFQGHACSVENQQQVKDAKEVLLQNKKISQATHNILAYRVCLENGIVQQDYDDDGEAHAGGRLLHLLQMLNVKNVMVIVTRWYGGIHLGPDRFRHINNAARQVLQQAGFLKD